MSTLYSLHCHCLNNIISPLQFGFLPHHSTSPALLFATCSFRSILYSHTSVSACFLDLKKAFNSVPHATFLHLLSTLNCPHFFLNWLHFCLTGCSQCIIVSGSTSASLTLSTNVKTMLMTLLYSNPSVLLTFPYFRTISVLSLRV